MMAGRGAVARLPLLVAPPTARLQADMRQGATVILRVEVWTSRASVDTGSLGLADAVALEAAEVSRLESPSVLRRAV